MKKVLAAVGVALSSVAAFAEGGANLTFDTAEANAVISAAKTGMETFVTTNAPLIGGIALSLLVFSMIMLGIKLIKRTRSAA